MSFRYFCQRHLIYGLPGNIVNRNFFISKAYKPCRSVFGIHIDKMSSRWLTFVVIRQSPVGRSELPAPGWGGR